jgi:hypothetical protein
VGLSSYLLINFWFTRIQANKAAIKAMLVNRIGDFALLLALLCTFFTFNSLDYDVVFSLVPLAVNYTIVLADFHVSAIDFICLFLFLGAMGKSAQLTLHSVDKNSAWVFKLLKEYENVPLVSQENSLIIRKHTKNLYLQLYFVFIFYTKRRKFLVSSVKSEFLVAVCTF